MSLFATAASLAGGSGCSSVSSVASSSVANVSELRQRSKVRSAPVSSAVSFRWPAVASRCPAHGDAAFARRDHERRLGQDEVLESKFLGAIGVATLFSPNMFCKG